MAVLGVPMLLAPVFGPVIGGLIVDNASWRWIFYVNVPVVLLALALAARLLTSDQGRADAGRLDWVGVALLPPGLAAVVFGLSEVESHGGIGAPAAWGPIALGLVLLALFAWHGWRAERPLIDVRLFAQRCFRPASLAITLAGAALFGSILVLALYYQVARGESALSTGLLLAPQGLGAAAVMPIAGRLTDKLGGGHVSAVGFALLTLGTLPWAWVSADTPYGLLSVALVVRGIGLGCAMMPTMAAAYAHLRPPQVPRATATMNALAAHGRLDRDGAAGGRADARAGAGVRRAGRARRRLGGRRFLLVRAGLPGRARARRRAARERVRRDVLVGGGLDARWRSCRRWRWRCASAASAIGRPPSHRPPDLSSTALDVRPVHLHDAPPVAVVPARQGGAQRGLAVVLSGRQDRRARLQRRRQVDAAADHGGDSTPSTAATRSSRPARRVGLLEQEPRWTRQGRARQRRGRRRRAARPARPLQRAVDELLRRDRRRVRAAAGADRRGRRLEPRHDARHGDGRAAAAAGRRRRRRSCPAASGGASRSAGCCCARPTCCCSTSRRTTSTPSRSRGWSSTCTSTEGRSSRSPTIATSSTTSPAGSSSSTAGAGSPTRATTPAGSSRSSSGSSRRSARTRRASARSRRSSSGCG